MMALALPLMDTCLSIGRRILRNKPVFSPDRGHIHHRLLAQGLHPRAAVLVLYAACAVAAILSLLQNSLSFHLGGLCIVSFCALSWFGVKKLRYVEFRAASRVLRSGGILHLVQHEIYLQGLRELLLESQTPRECWRAIRMMCQDLRFASVDLSLEGEKFQELFDSVGTRSAWEFSLPLGERGRIHLTRRFGQGDPMHLLAAVCVVQECLEEKRFESSRAEEVAIEMEGLAGIVAAPEHGLLAGEQNHRPLPPAKAHAATAGTHFSE